MICEICGLEMVETDISFYDDERGLSCWECNFCEQDEELIGKMVEEQLQDFISSDYETISVSDFKQYIGEINNLEEHIEEAVFNLGYAKGVEGLK